MKNNAGHVDGISRRDLLRLSAFGLMAVGLGLGTQSPGRAETSASGRSSSGPYNILFLLTDQERFFRPGELPTDYAFSRT